MTVLTDGGPSRFYPDCLRYGDNVPATPVAETAEQRVAKLEQLLQASQAEAAQVSEGERRWCVLSLLFTPLAPDPSDEWPGGCDGQSSASDPPGGLKCPCSLAGRGLHRGVVCHVADTPGAAGEGAAGEEQCAAAAGTHQCFSRHHECGVADFTARC